MSFTPVCMLSIFITRRRLQCGWRTVIAPVAGIGVTRYGVDAWPLWHIEPIL